MDFETHIKDLCKMSDLIYNKLCFYVEQDKNEV